MRIVGSTLAAFVCLASVGRADEDPTHRFPSRAVHTHQRAGNPLDVKPHAVMARNHLWTGGYVGGGRLAIFPRKPDGRNLEVDGTWGWDYVGYRRPGHVFLDWWHGRKHEPSMGTYRTDGPHIPDPIAAHPIQKFILGHGHEEEK